VSSIGRSGGDKAQSVSPVAAFPAHTVVEGKETEKGVRPWNPSVSCLTEVAPGQSPLAMTSVPPVGPSSKGALLAPEDLAGDTAH
jgi:hypothetical protein